MKKDEFLTLMRKIATADKPNMTAEEIEERINHNFNFLAKKLLLEIAAQVDEDAMLRLFNEMVEAKDRPFAIRFDIYGRKGDSAKKKKL